MNLCSEGHEEICFESGQCPLCVANKTIDEQDGEIFDLEEKIKELERQL